MCGMCCDQLVLADMCDNSNIMAFTLWTLFEATLLCLNAVCVLNEERFLAKVGWASWQNVQGFGESPTPKSQILNLIKSIRTVMRDISGRILPDLTERLQIVQEIYGSKKYPKALREVTKMQRRSRLCKRVVRFTVHRSVPTLNPFAYNVQLPFNILTIDSLEHSKTKSLIQKRDENTIVFKLYKRLKIICADISGAQIQQ